MKNKFNLFGAALAIGIMFANCTSINKSMKEPNAHVQWQKSDFVLSDQGSAEAKSTTIFNIDFAHLFNKETGTAASSSLSISSASIPVIGTVLADQTANYALYELMTKNPGYDVIFYPQYETKVVCPLGLSFLIKNTQVKATARLGKLK